MIESKITKADLFYKPSSSIAIIWCQFFVGIAIFILSYYLIDDAFGVWNEAAVTADNVTKFFFGLLLCPLGWLLWGSAIFRLSSVTTYNSIINIIFLTLLVIALFTIGGVYFVEWGIADWLEWSSTFDSTTLVQVIQAVYLVLTMWTTAVTVFHILVRAILQRSLYSNEAKMNSVSKTINAEHQPLMSSINNTESAIDTNTKFCARIHCRSDICDIYKCTCTYIQTGKK